MALPPLAPIPHLRRLLTPEEVLLYTVKFHPLRGWPWLAGCLACAGLIFVSAWFVLPAMVLLARWYMPFHTNEVAVTNDRLLLRTGTFHLLLEALNDEGLLHWKMEQNALTAMLNAGTITLKVRGEIGPLREITLPWVWHPMSFLEALAALQDEVVVKVKRAA